MKLVVFGFDASESAQIRRLDSLVECGHEVTALTMSRGDMLDRRQHPWRNIHLFRTGHQRLVRRIPILLAACLKLMRHRTLIASAEIILARNLDMLVLAHIGRLMSSKPSVPIIYECLDIHGSLTGMGLTSRFLRQIERWLLARVSLLVVSSPGFLTHYFEPIQRYRGPVHILENKIWFGRHIPPRPLAREPIADARLSLVWAGALRCEASFALLLETARALGERVRVDMHGIVHRHVLKNFEQRIAALPNMRFHGTYDYPHGLEAIYAKSHFVWAQDLWQPSANSAWLLPNRIYEAGYFGCLSIAVAGTETGRKIEQDGLGFVIPNPTAEALVGLLTGLDRAKIAHCRARVLASPDDCFVQTPADIAAMLAAVGHPASGQTAP